MGTVLAGARAKRQFDHARTPIWQTGTGLVMDRGVDLTTVRPMPAGVKTNTWIQPTTGVDLEQHGRRRWSCRTGTAEMSNSCPPRGGMTSTLAMVCEEGACVSQNETLHHRRTEAPVDDQKWTPESETNLRANSRRRCIFGQATTSADEDKWMKQLSAHM